MPETKKSLSSWKNNDSNQILFCSKRFWHFVFWQLAVSQIVQLFSIMTDASLSTQPISLWQFPVLIIAWLFANHSWLRFPATKGALQVKGFKSFVMEENNLRIWNSSYRGDTKATLKIGQIWRKTCQKGAGGWGLPKSQRKHTKYTNNNKNIDKELCWEKRTWNAK